jgi:hypothetical protein
MALVGSISGSLSLIAVTGSFEPGISDRFAIGATNKKWSNMVSTALSGSLTKLSDGTTDFIAGGGNITLVTGSNGQITISGPTPITAHTGLSALNFANSGHTGAATSVAAFTSAGVAQTIQATADGQVLTLVGGVLVFVAATVYFAQIRIPDVGFVLDHSSSPGLVVQSTGTIGGP